MNTKTALLFIFLLIIIPYEIVLPQDEPDLLQFQMSADAINRKAMLILGGWAAANIITGGIGNFTSKGQSKYFHQFNAMWNTINLGIAAFGYISASEIDSAVNMSRSLKEYNALTGFLLLNAGLDAAYIVTGLLLREKSSSSVNNSDLLKGYGTSLLLQGAFLLAFDLILYFIHQNNAEAYLFPYVVNSFDTPAAVNISFGMVLRL